ncbi:hypothetical protein MTO96_019582 [Rhipicephalus appendiculatus]
MCERSRSPLRSATPAGAAMLALPSLPRVMDTSARSQRKQALTPRRRLLPAVRSRRRVTSTGSLALPRPSFLPFGPHHGELSIACDEEERRQTEPRGRGERETAARVQQHSAVFLLTAWPPIDGALSNVSHSWACLRDAQRGRGDAGGYCVYVRTSHTCCQARSAAMWAT